MTSKNCNHLEMTSSALPSHDDLVENSVPGKQGPIIQWEERLTSWLKANMAGDDPAHDLDHLLQVLATAQHLADEEGEGDPLVILAASLLHDIVNVPKDHSDRHLASRMSAERAGEILTDLAFPQNLIPAVQHAIEAHSFSAGIEPQTIEAKIVQDADRLDALGARGIVRWVMVSMLMKRPLLDRQDPLAENRPLNDYQYGLDHFPVKLLKIADTMKTTAGRTVARERTKVMESFRRQLVSETKGIS